MASIRKRGDTYQITVSNGRDSTGKQIIETATFAPDPSRTEKQNRKALEKFVFEFEDKVKSGKYLDGEKMTFQAFSEIWFTDYANQQLEASTSQLYRHLLQLHILPAIGHLKLAKVQPAHLNKLYNTLSQERKDGKPGGYASKTIKHVHVLISGIYSAAVKWNAVMENPCDRVTPPKQTPARDKIKYFTLEQTELFLSLLDRYHTPTGLKLFFHMALFCGMRRGELIALEWSDLDFTNNSVSITKSTSVVNGKPLKKRPRQLHPQELYLFRHLSWKLQGSTGKSSCNTVYPSDLPGKGTITSLPSGMENKCIRILHTMLLKNSLNDIIQKILLPIRYRISRCMV